jgi:hypothetical protein
LAFFRILHVLKSDSYKLKNHTFGVFQQSQQVSVKSRITSVEDDCVYSLISPILLDRWNKKRQTVRQWMTWQFGNG